MQTLHLLPAAAWTTFAMSSQECPARTTCVAPLGNIWARRVRVQRCIQASGRIHTIQAPSISRPVDQYSELSQAIG